MTGIVLAHELSFSVTGVTMQEVNIRAHEQARDYFGEWSYGLRISADQNEISRDGVVVNYRAIVDAVLIDKSS